MNLCHIFGHDDEAMFDVMTGRFERRCWNCDERAPEWAQHGLPEPSDYQLLAVRAADAVAAVAASIEATTQRIGDSLQEVGTRMQEVLDEFAQSVDEWWAKR